MFKVPLFLALSLAISASVVAADYQVEQKGMAFSTQELKIKAGDTVVFKNADNVNHNLFSVSDAKSFDLGSFAQNQSRSVIFDKPGIVEVECAIHPDMKMNIKVSQ